MIFSNFTAKLGIIRGALLHFNHFVICQIIPTNFNEILHPPIKFPPNLPFPPNSPNFLPGFQNSMPKHFLIVYIQNLYKWSRRFENIGKYCQFDGKIYLGKNNSNNVRHIWDFRKMFDGFKRKC